MKSFDLAMRGSRRLSKVSIRGLTFCEKRVALKAKFVYTFIHTTDIHLLCEGWPEAPA